MSSPPNPVVITAAVEGLVDEALLRRLCTAGGATVAQVYGRYGKSYILKRLSGYNYSARFRHWVVLLDLDDDAQCAPDAVLRWLPEPARLMRLRVAVKEAEAWLLADAERMSRFLGLPLGEMPTSPEDLEAPKRFVVELARRSRRRAIREDMVPLLGSGQAVGPAYTSRMIEFIRDVDSGWRPSVAAEHCSSLRKCIAAISHLVAQPFIP
jgi:hypothetical protein